MAVIRWIKVLTLSENVSCLYSGRVAPITGYWLGTFEVAAHIFLRLAGFNPAYPCLNFSHFVASQVPGSVCCPGEIRFPGYAAFPW